MSSFVAIVDSNIGLLQESLNISKETDVVFLSYRQVFEAGFRLRSRCKCMLERHAQSWVDRVTECRVISIRNIEIAETGFTCSSSPVWFCRNLFCLVDRCGWKQQACEVRDAGYDVSAPNEAREISGN